MTKQIVIRGGTVIDGTGADPIPNGVVVVEDDRITSIGRHDRGEKGTRRIDATGATVLPGLIDLHVHFCALSVEDARSGVTPATTLSTLLRALDNARCAIESGVTTCRDLGSQDTIFAFKQAVASGRILGPRLLVSGKAICMTGGHGYNMAAQEADGPDEVTKAARTQLKAGADCLKVMATAGAVSLNARPEDTQLTVEEMAAAVHEDHHKGKRVAAHVTCLQGARNCLAAGIDTIEHGLQLDEELVHAIARQGTFLVPTLWVGRQVANSGPESGLSAASIAAFKQLQQRHGESLSLARAAGVKIGAGTDTGFPGAPMNRLPAEIALLVEAGLTPMEALQSATRVAAEALGRCAQVGTLEAGKLADIVLVDGDPLADITAVAKTRLTMKGGKVLYERNYAM